MQEKINDFENYESKREKSERRTELDSTLWAEILKPNKVIRDAVHGDIWISKLEKILLDTPEFQRLRGIKQLGTVHLIYPSAIHTRFGHSLGTLYIAQKFIDVVEKNYKYQESNIGKDFITELAEKPDNDTIWGYGPLRLYSLSNRDKALIRITALLHDAAHIPFGHVLEKEGCLNELKNSQWADDERMRTFFDNCFSRHILNYFKNIGFESQCQEFLKDLKNILKSIEENDSDTAIGTLNDIAFIGDIIGDTICSDLLDYLVRDSHFTGFKLTYDPRIIENFAVFEDPRTGIRRLTLLLIKKNKFRPDMLSSVFHLLDLRYQLSETVYYHRVKTAFSAILIDFIYNAMQLKIITKHDLFNLKDETLIYKIKDRLENKKLSDFELIDDKSYRLERIENLLPHYDKREKYKPIYMVHHREDGNDKNLIDSIIKRYTNPDERFKFQQEMEDLFNLKPGSVIMFVTKKDKGKDASVKVIWNDNNIRSLKEMDDEIISGFAKNLSKRYSMLWRLYIFVEEGLVIDYGDAMSGYCKYKLFDINDIEDKNLSNAMERDEVSIYMETYQKDSSNEIALRNQFKAHVSNRPLEESFQNLSVKQKLDELYRYI